MRLVRHLALVFCVLSAVSVCAQNVDPLQLVKDAVANEIQDNLHPTDFWMYRLAKESKSGTQVKDMVETKQGIVARLIAYNGRQLTETERAADDKRLSDLAANPSEQQRKRDDQKKEQDRFLAIIKAMPDALIYTSDGIEPIDGRETIRLRFKPNPSFHTTTRETIIFKAAEGFIWIDAAEKRILKFDGLQTSDINIGWGLLGHIDKGSRLHLEQKRLAQGKWRLNRLDLEGSGQILLFKSLSLKQKQSASDFRPVADLTYPQAVELLKKQDLASAAAH
jgi:hypothetical protein